MTNSSVAVDVIIVVNWGKGLNWQRVQGGCLGTGNVLYLDLGGGYMGVCMCRTSWRCILKIRVVCCT